MPQISRQRALAILAKSADGRTEAILRARGITQGAVAGLIRDGLVTATEDRVGQGRRIGVVRIKITEAGRIALSEVTIEPPSIPRVDPTSANKEDEECVVEDERRKVSDILPRPNIMIRCPTFGKPVPTGLSTAAILFESLGNVSIPLRCPSCSATHWWQKKDAWDETKAAPMMARGSGSFHHCAHLVRAGSVERPYRLARLLRQPTAEMARASGSFHHCGPSHRPGAGPTDCGPLVSNQNEPSG